MEILNLKTTITNKEFTRELNGRFGLQKKETMNMKIDQDK